MKLLAIVLAGWLLAVPVRGLDIKATCVNDNTELVASSGIEYLMVGDTVTIREVNGDSVTLATGRAGARNFKVKYEQGMALLADALRQKEYSANLRQYSAADLQTTPEIGMFLRNSFGLGFGDILRNEVYARHGDVFEKKFYRDLFQAISWYKLNPRFNAMEFNGYEQTNIRWLKDNRGAGAAQEASADIETGLIACYPLDGNARDASGHRLNGKIFGARLVNDRFGNPGKAYGFDGMHDYIEVPYSSKLDITKAISISVWVRFDQYPGYYKHIVNKALWDQAPGWKGNYWLAIGPSGAWTFSFGGPVRSRDALDHWSKAVLTMGAWHHLACTFDSGSDTLKLYCDGVLDQVYIEPNDMAPDQFPLWIGQSGHLRDRFAGDIDDVRIYGRVLTAQEVAALNHEGGWPIVPKAAVTDSLGIPGLVAYYPFNGDASDASGHGRNGAVAGPEPAADRFGRQGRAFSFDGVNNRIVLPTVRELGMYDHDFAVSVWICGKGFAGRDPAILGTDNGSNSTVLHLVLRGCKPYMGFCWNDSWIDTQLQPDTWYHLVFQYDRVARQQVIYLNGREGARGGSHDPLLATEPVNVGRWYNGRSSFGSTYFYGAIDDIRIYDRVLDKKEVMMLYHEGRWK